MQTKSKNSNVGLIGLVATLLMVAVVFGLSYWGTNPKFMANADTAAYAAPVFPQQQNNAPLVTSAKKVYTLPIATAVDGTEIAKPKSIKEGIDVNASKNNEKRLRDEWSQQYIDTGLHNTVTYTLIRGTETEYVININGVQLTVPRSPNTSFDRSSGHVTLRYRNIRFSEMIDPNGQPKKITLELLVRNIDFGATKFAS